MDNSTRLPQHRGGEVEITYAGKAVRAYEGEMLAAALLAAGEVFGTTREGDGRLPLCNMGTCFDCAVVVDGAPLVRACLTPVRQGMQIEPTKGL